MLSRGLDQSYSSLGWFPMMCCRGLVLLAFGRRGALTMIERQNPNLHCPRSVARSQWREDFGSNVRSLSAIVDKPSLTGDSVITFNRNARCNAANPVTARKLHAAFLQFEDKHTQRVCVVHGANGIFCARTDLRRLDKKGRTKESHLGSVSGSESL